MHIPLRRANGRKWDANWTNREIREDEPVEEMDIAVSKIAQVDVFLDRCRLGS